MRRYGLRDDRFARIEPLLLVVLATWDAVVSLAILGVGPGASGFFGANQRIRAAKLLLQTDLPLGREGRMSVAGSVPRRPSDESGREVVRRPTT